MTVKIKFYDSLNFTYSYFCSLMSFRHKTSAAKIAISDWGGEKTEGGCQRTNFIISTTMDCQIVSCSASIKTCNNLFLQNANSAKIRAPSLTFEQWKFQINCKGLKKLQRIKIQCKAACEQIPISLGFLTTRNMKNSSYCPSSVSYALCLLLNESLRAFCKNLSNIPYTFFASHTRHSFCKHLHIRIYFQTCSVYYDSFIITWYTSLWTQFVIVNGIMSQAVR